MWNFTKSAAKKKLMISMKKVFFLFFVCIYLSACTERYHNHFYSQRQIATQEVATSGDFSFSGKIFTFPETGNENFLIEAIQNAKEKIFIEIYTFTKNEKIFQSLVDAKNRGVDVRVLLE